MGLEVYYPQDIRNVLLAADQACAAALQAVGREDESARIYHEGYQAALATVALAFGLIPSSSRSGSRERQLIFLSANVEGAEPNFLARLATTILSAP